MGFDRRWNDRDALRGWTAGLVKSRPHNKCHEHPSGRCLAASSPGPEPQPIRRDVNAGGESDGSSVRLYAGAA